MVANPVLYRAVRNLSVSIENDPEEMVQQQLARLKFMLKHLPLSGARVLEFGCGSGLNSAYLAENTDIAHVAGFDFSAAAVELARSQYPEHRFSVADGCDPNLNIEAGTWDVVFSTEVLEHVPDMAGFLCNVKRHLKPGGVAFISTPNRDVFSLGHEPSPINAEHIKEPNIAEFKELLATDFSGLEIYGQRFKRQSLRDEWHESTLNKIEQLKAGTRWNRREPSLGMRIVGKLRRDFLPMPKGPYYHSDFEFTKNLSDAIWFCAICRKEQ